MPLSDFKEAFPLLCSRLEQAKRNGRTGQAYLFLGDDAAFLKGRCDADRTERRNRDLRAVRLFNGAHGVPDTARKLSVELRDEAELRQERRMGAEFVNQEMLACAGTVDVPERVADQVFHAGMVGGLFGANYKICHKEE